MSNTGNHNDLVETFSALDRMHQHAGIELRANDAYDVPLIEQLLEISGCVVTTAVIARTSLEQIVAGFMADQHEQELKDFLDELAMEARTKGLDPIAYVTQFAEGELGAVKGYARRLRNLISCETLKPNEESRQILNCQLAEVIGNWVVFVRRARYMASELVFEPT